MITDNYRLGLEIIFQQRRLEKIVICKDLDVEVNESSGGGDKTLRTMIGLLVMMMMRLLVQCCKYVKLASLSFGSRQLVARSRQGLKKTKAN